MEGALGRPLLGWPPWPWPHLQPSWGPPHLRMELRWTAMTRMMPVSLGAQRAWGGAGGLQAYGEGMGPCWVCVGEAMGTATTAAVSVETTALARLNIQYFSRDNHPHSPVAAEPGT